ncbi:MAG: glycosyltransferase family 39 protein [bacterium]|nr:glycosyltransferase family 39 protein [bacterium]
MKKRKSAKQKKVVLPSFLTKEVIIVVGLLFLALILRLIFLFQIKEIDLILAGSDMQTYHNYALAIIDGSFPKEPYYYSPLYPYFVALVYSILEPNPLTVRTIQAILGVLTCLLIYLIGKKVFDQKVGLISLFLSCLYGMFLCYEGILLIETLSCFLTTLSLFLLLKPSWRNIIFGGIALGLASLTRANILLFIPFIFCWMILDMDEPKKRIIAKFALLSLVLSLTILPCTIRNYLVSKRFVLISTSGPINFWMGNNRYADGQYYNPTLPFQIAHAESVQRKAKEKGDRAYLEDVLDFAKESPLSFIGLQLKKFFLFWGRDEIANNISYEWVRSVSSLLRLPFIIDFSIIAPLGLIGAFFSLRKRRFGVLLLILFLFAYSTATTIIFVLSRYRLPVEPILLIFSSFSISFLYGVLKKRDMRRLILFLALLFLFICLLNARRGFALVYPKIFTNGRYAETQEGLLIQDISDIHRIGKGPGLLDSPKDSLRKELIIDRDPKAFDSAILFIDASLIPRGEARLIIKVNEKELSTDISHRIHPKEEFITTRISLPLNIEWLKKGKNLFELRVAEDGWLSVPIDSSFCYKRSSFRDSEEKESKEIKGEYQISLWLQKNP